jgi:hypothetical protein
MIDERHDHPQMPDQDQRLDQLLASLAHFAPSPGFDNRVMARVRVGAVPAAAAVARQPRRRRWPAVVAPLAGVAAVSSTALTAWAVVHFGAIAAWTTMSLAALAVPMWHAALAWLATAGASASSALLAAALTVGLGSWIWVAAVLNLAVPVSLIGLVMVARPYLRKQAHVAR